MKSKSLKIIFMACAIVLCFLLSVVVLKFVTKGACNAVAASIPAVLIYAVGFGFLLLGVRELVKEMHPVYFGFLLMLTALTLFIRIALLPNQSDDFIEYLSIWLQSIREMPGTASIVADIGNYNMPYFYFLFLLGKIAPQTVDLFAIKFLSIIFDYVLAFYVMKLVGLATDRKNVRIAAFFVTLMIPSVILNGAMWGQCDSMFTAFALGALYYGLKNKSYLCWIFFAIALSYKLQTVFLLPIVIVFIFTKRVRLKDVWTFFATFLLLLVPAMCMGRSFINCINIYWHQANTYSELSMNAANLYAWFPEGTRSNIPVAASAIFAAGMITVCFVLYLYLRKDRLNEDRLIQAGYLFTLIIPFFLPMMHDRYFYIADAMACVYLFYHPKKWYIPALSIIPSFLCHTATLFKMPVFPMPVLAVSIFASLSLLLFSFVKDIEEQKKTELY